MRVSGGRPYVQWVDDLPFERELFHRPTCAPFAATIVLLRLQLGFSHYTGIFEKGMIILELNWSNFKKRYHLWP